LSKHNELGKQGEILAGAYLAAKGHIILETNYRYAHKEIDIISLCGDVLVFTEIKARSSYAFGYPEEAVTPRKQNLLKQAAEYYCLDKPQYVKLRFDVLSLLLNKGDITEALHFEDAFY
jgi:putative endonuclease